MDGVRFASPWVLWSLLLLPPLALAAFARGGARALAVGSVADALAARATWRTRADRLLPALRLLAVVALIVAIARPQRGVASTATPLHGADIVLALDTSASMTLPFAGSETRLDAAKAALSRFVRSSNGDRLGVVIFQASTLTLSPLTADYWAVDADIAAAGGARLADGTAIGLAIAASVDALRHSTAASRIVILLTDGENNVHEVEPLAAARIAQALGVRVYVVGVGGGAGMPDAARFTVDERTMREVAAATGGTYGRAEDAVALQAAYDQIARLEQSRLPGALYARFDEYSSYVLAAAALLLALDIVMRHSVLRRLA
ncbi:MAG TPA: VWA domain-containing protein [Dehalococcoidia bacterium]|nr:VWA domain-containing protein [Dehalococcoidia bacterium]